MRQICFYLPQYHPIPENDRWWGDGFTEWANVRKAQPLYRGHYQPHVPERLGYYDLRDSRIRCTQAELAGAHGIHGFCYYHYWFNGKRLLHRPFDDVLRSGQPDFPFCLCWANENWTRRWDGGSKDVLISQEYSHEDDRRFIEALVPAFRDKRYIRVNGKPLLVVYCTDLLPDPKKTAEIWRENMHRLGVGDIYLARVERHVHDRCENPEKIGFDAAIEFAPCWGRLGPQVLPPAPLLPNAAGRSSSLYDYENCMFEMLGREVPDYKLFRGIFPAWDNSARRVSGATILVNSSPEKYAFWLSHLANYTLSHFSGDEQLIFVNAWNEWAEGCHLEPDSLHGTRNLEAGRDAVQLAHEFHRARKIFDGDSPDSFSYTQWHKGVLPLLKGTDKEKTDANALLWAMYGFLDYQILSEAKPRIQEQLRRIVAVRDEELKSIRRTASWRITRPLRSFFEKVSSIRNL